MGEKLSHEIVNGTILQKTGHICADCGGDIVYTEEAALIQMVQPQVFSGKPFFHPIIDEADPSGDFLFTPYYFCFPCWERNYNELHDELEEFPPTQDGVSLFECICCGSGIREWEYAGTFTFGEFQLSKRAPNNARGPHFTPSGKPEVMCIFCMALFNDTQIELWDDCSQIGECLDCTLARCWRNQTCTCDCHIPEPEEVEIQE